MSSRYKRRKKRRKEKFEKEYRECLDFEKVFTYDHLYDSYKKCRRNVSWKPSVQKYIVNAPINISKTKKELLEGKFKSKGFYEFELRERGKLRQIRSVDIRERVVKRCFCDYALVPVLARSFIYDNGASVKNKGYHFTIKRLKVHLMKHYRKFGNEGYVLLFDFSKFFDNISHDVVKDIIDKNFEDERIRKLAHYFIDTFGEIGLGLGAQESQILSLAVGSAIDHVVKGSKIKYYGRYMDDGYIISDSKEELKEMLIKIEKVCKTLKININKKKTQIIKLTHGFTWLKARIFITDTGKIIMKPCKASIVRYRKKMKKLKKKLDKGEITFEDVYISHQCYRAYLNNFNAYNTMKATNKLFDELFIYERKEYEYVLQIDN